MIRILILLFFLFRLPGYSFVVGNFADPSLYKDGIFLTGKRLISFRTGFISDYVYKIDLKDEFISPDPDPSHLEISTYAALLALNFVNHLDIYSILGATKISDDDLGFVPRKFSWSVGAKATFFKVGKLSLGGDLKYYRTEQKPAFYVLEDGIPAFVTTRFHLVYEEYQAALGAAYDFGFIIPYAGGTYLDAKLEPNPLSGGLDIPALDMDFVFDARTSVNKTKWGLVWGITLLAAKTVSLSVESRHFDQQDVNVTGEIRF